MFIGRSRGFVEPWHEAKSDQIRSDQIRSDLEGAVQASTGNALHGCFAKRAFPQLGMDFH
jgi:hypothetical protein